MSENARPWTASSQAKSYTAFKRKFRIHSRKFCFFPACLSLSLSLIPLAEFKGNKTKIPSRRDKRTRRRESQYFEEEVKTLLGPLGHTPACLPHTCPCCTTSVLFASALRLNSMPPKSPHLLALRLLALASDLSPHYSFVPVILLTPYFLSFISLAPSDNFDFVLPKLHGTS